MSAGFADAAAAEAALTAVAVDSIVAERAGVLGLARKHCSQVDALIARGGMTALEGGLLKERLRAFADQVATGLHRDGADPVGVRVKMRALAA